MAVAMVAVCFECVSRREGWRVSEKGERRVEGVDDGEKGLWMFTIIYTISVVFT